MFHFNTLCGEVKHALVSTNNGEINNCLTMHACLLGVYWKHTRWKPQSPSQQVEDYKFARMQYTSISGGSRKKKSSFNRARELADRSIHAWRGNFFVLNLSVSAGILHNW